MHSLTKKKSAKHLEIRFHAYLQNKVKLPYLAESYVACEQALLFGRAKRVSRECASERRSRKGQRKGPSLARSREARLNRRACSQAKSYVDLWSQSSSLLICYSVPTDILLEHFPGCSSHDN